MENDSLQRYLNKQSTEMLELLWQRFGEGDREYAYLMPEIQTILAARGALPDGKDPSTGEFSC